MHKAEEERLEREEFEAREFVPNLERMLLAVDQSPNGKFAARLAGLIAGPRGLPTTVLALSETGKSKARGRGKPEKEDAEDHDRVGEGVKAAAEESKQRRISDDEPGRVDVTVRRLEASSEDAVARRRRRATTSCSRASQTPPPMAPSVRTSRASPRPSKGRWPSPSARASISGNPNAAPCTSSCR